MSECNIFTEITKISGLLAIFLDSALTGIPSSRIRIMFTHKHVKLIYHQIFNIPSAMIAAIPEVDIRNALDDFEVVSKLVQVLGNLDNIL